MPYLKTKLMIPKNIFNKLMETAKCQTGDETDVVGFDCRYGKWGASFQLDLGDLIVEDFGSEMGQDWVQMEPTEKQKDSMARICNVRIAEIERERMIQEQLEADYHRYGQEGAIYSKFY